MLELIQAKPSQIHNTAIKLSLVKSNPAIDNQPDDTIQS
jgi:hypothetical protein